MSQPSSSTLDQSAILKTRELYLAWLQKRRQALLMELAEIEDQLIESKVLQRRTIESHASRRTHKH